MNEAIFSSMFFGVSISLVAYWIGMLLKKQFKLAIFNPLLISVIIVITVLCGLKIDYSSYKASTESISFLLTPSTICLAIPLYQQFDILKKNWKAVVASITAGTVASLSSVLLMAILFGLTHEQYATLLPKSVTTAIAVGISEVWGGMVSITSAVVIITGIVGGVSADFVFKLAKIEEPVAKGLACGTSAHAIGTSKAMELGEVEGAMSSLSIAVAGVLTSLVASVFARLY